MGGLAKKLIASAGGEEKLYVDDVFSTYLYTGNGSTQTINNGIDLAGKGGMVWIKQRDGGFNYRHVLVDSDRGVNKYLSSNLTDAQVTEPTPPVSSFNATGFSLASPLSTGAANNSGINYTSWTFRNADRFFTHTTVSHTNGTPTNISLSSLGTVGQVVAKITNTTGDWIVWHRSLTAGNNLRLNTTAAQTTTNAWLSVSGTTATLSATAPTGTYVIHAWAHDPSEDGIIQCGSFTTDGSGNATVNLGWEPQWVLLKRSDGSLNWRLVDSMRGLNNSGENILAPNVSDAEIASGTASTKPTATGFTHNGNVSATYIYLTIRRPNKPPTSGTEVYNAIARTGTGAAATVTGVGFAPDFLIPQTRTPSGSGTYFFDKLRGVSSVIYPWGAAAEFTQSDVLLSFNMNGVTVGADTGGYTNKNGDTYINHFLRRAPGFMDVVCYTGTGVARTVPHSLGVAPELMIVKNRTDGSVNWAVYAQSLSASNNVWFNLTNSSASNGAAYWNSTAPTSSVFSIGTNITVNGTNQQIVAYLFATLAGISKVGSYTGNGSSQTISCGFTTGARFILIKRTDSTGDWYVWDSARGIVAANDPHLSLNTTAAEVTTNDSVDPESSGFIVNQNTATNINVNGGSYIFLAIA